MLNFFRSRNTNTNTNGKVLAEIDKKLNMIESQVENLLKTDKSLSQKQKIIYQLTKDMDSLYKTIFDSKFFNMCVFEYIVEKNIISLLTSYLGLQNLDLIKLVIPLVDKILFDSKEFYDKIEISEEILWMNSSVVNSLKILIHTMKSFLIDVTYDESLVCSLITFLFKFLNKLVLYPNFYFAISSSNFVNSGTSESHFDSVLFEIIIELFSLEHLIENREAKAKLSKSLLLCLNLDNFYTIQINYVEKLIEYLVNNLVYYYEKYKNFDPNKNLNNLEISQNLKKEKISLQDLTALNASDIISYLKYFSIILHCFSQPEIKKYLSNLLFNKLLIEQIQKDILNIYITSDSEKRIYKVAEFIFYFTKYVRNKETSQIIFYFFFGFNSYTPITEEFYLSDEEEEPQKIELEDLSPCEENLVNLGKVNIDNLIKNNFSNKLNLNVNIDKTSHKFENILAFLMTILEASFKNMSNIKITFINIFKNIIKNTPNLFLSEVLVPYYVNYLNNQTKIFDKIYEKVKSTREKINMIEIVKNIHPKNFPLDLDDWSEYFEVNLEKNYQRNIWILENEENGDKTQEENDLNILNDDEISGNLFLDNTSGTPRKTDLDLDTTSPSIFKEDSSRSINVNFTNNTYVTRIRFYDTLVKCFKNFVTNPYNENLYLTSLFTEIFSLPYSGEKNEGIYNIYSNMTFAVKKKFILFNVSSVGLISHITNKLDEYVKIKYTKDEIVKLIYSRVNEKYNGVNMTKKNTIINTLNLGKNNLNVNGTVKDGLFIDNLVLFLEFYKEYISNIFTKCYFDQINFNYTRATNNLN